jgi:hypothetical protein
MRNIEPTSEAMIRYIAVVVSNIRKKVPNNRTVFHVEAILSVYPLE